MRAFGTESVDRKRNKATLFWAPDGRSLFMTMRGSLRRNALYGDSWQVLCNTWCRFRGARRRRGKSCICGPRFCWMENMWCTRSSIPPQAIIARELSSLASPIKKGPSRDRIPSDCMLLRFSTRIPATCCSYAQAIFWRSLSTLAHSGFRVSLLRSSPESIPSSPPERRIFRYK